MRVQSLFQHVDVYLDESGDTGFSCRSSRHLVVIALATAQPHQLSRLVRKARRKFGSTRGTAAEFKFSSSGEQLRGFILQNLAMTDARIVWGGVCKADAARGPLRGSLQLWKHVAGRTLSEMSMRTHAKSMHLTIDKFSNRLSVRTEVACRMLNEIVSHHGGHFPPEITITQVDSMKSEGLQLADFVAGAVFQSVENGDDHYLVLLGSTVIHGGLFG